MTIGSLTMPQRRRLADLLSYGGILAGGSVAALAFGVWVQEPNRARLAVSAVGCLAVLGLLSRSPRHLLYAVLVWLSMLGILRRIVSEVAPISNADPILLVSPLALGLLVHLAWKRGAFERLTRLGKGVIALQALILLGAVNPLQGSIPGGIAGLLFVLVPTLGFWIGRAFCDDRTLAVLLRVIAVLGVVIALYGLAQILVGFPSWDQHWIDTKSVGSLQVEGAIRSFGTLTSAAEYGTFLAVALIVWFAYWLRPLAAPIAIPAIGLLGTAVFLESSRGLVVLTVAAVAVVLSAKARLPGLATIAVAALLLVGLGYVARHVSAHPTGTATSALVSHQVQGLSNPLDPNASTATIHYAMLMNGIRAGFHNPIGEGIGAITIAGSRFGGVAAGTELDPSNASVALGLPGLLAYVFVVCIGFRRLYARARTTGAGLAAAALGISAVTGLQWLNGGQYAVAILPWLMLGWVDRPLEDARDD